MPAPSQSPFAGRLRYLIAFAFVACISHSISADEGDEVVEIQEDVAVEADAEEVIVVEAAAMEFAEVDLTHAESLKIYARVQTAMARRIAQLTEDQEQQLAIITEEWITQTLRKASGKGDGNVQQGGIMAGLAQAFGFNQPVRFEEHVEPHILADKVRQAIDSHIESVLDETQRANLKKEREAAMDFQKDAMARLTVSMIERRVFITAEQREALTPLIAKRIGTNLAWRIYVQNPGYIPSIPNSTLSKVLDKTQMSSLSGLNRNDFDIHQFDPQMFGMQGVEPIER